MGIDRDPVVVIGDVNLDLSLCLDDLPTRGGESRVHDLSFGSGGAGLNAAVAFRTLGARARLLARVGRDLAADVALEVGRARGVDLTLLQVDQTLASGCCMVLVTPDGHRSFLSHRGANAQLSAPVLEDVMPSGTKLLFVSAYALLEGSQAEVAHAFIESHQDVPVVLDLGLPPARERREAILALLPHIFVLSGNEDELSTLFDGDTEPRAIARAIARGARNVAIKRGAGGASLIGAAGEHHRAARAIMPIDTTACGDAFSAALALLLSRGVEPGLALGFAVELGTLVAETRGAARSIPPHSSLRRRLEPQLATLLGEPEHEA